MSKYTIQESSFNDFRLLANDLYRKGDSYSDLDAVLKRLWIMKKEGILEVRKTKDIEGTPT